jgi:hypothetical protein
MTKAIEKMRRKKCEMIKEAKGGDGEIQARRRHGAASAENDCPLPSCLLLPPPPFTCPPLLPFPKEVLSVVRVES